MNERGLFETVRHVPVLPSVAGIATLGAAILTVIDAVWAPAVFAILAAVVLLPQCMVNAALSQRRAIAVVCMTLASGWAVVIAWLVYAPQPGVASVRLLVAILLVASAGMRVQQWTASLVRTPVAIGIAIGFALTSLQVLVANFGLVGVALAAAIEMAARGCDWLVMAWMAAKRLTQPDMVSRPQNFITAVGSMQAAVFNQSIREFQ